MKKQTATEWLMAKLESEFKFTFSSNILEEAKEIEKKQTIDFAWEMSGLTRIEIEKDYDKTFNQEEQ